MKLTPLQQRFVLHWGEMGSRWGVNRTIGQIHALLFLSDKPLNAEEITEALSVARSNVSTSLKELQSFDLVRVVHVMGDRRDHFEAEQDTWEIFKRVVAERRRREIDPTLSMLRNALLETAETSEDTKTQTKLRELHDFLDDGTRWLDEVERLSPETLMKIMKMGSRIQNVIRGGKTDSNKKTA